MTLPLSPSSAIVWRLLLLRGSQPFVVCLLTLRKQNGFGSIWMSEKITTHKSRDITVVLGGASSGKSAWAEQYILRRAEKVGYIATAQAF
ncbi:MAG: bifunctional adenosylcobinamide kinase/adenosylcobinamide-phosphate guanylyltransferase, partial [Paracoccaceae bacterium]